ncbi:hypothetical protein NPIL_299481 [Nephila pilipes]|uniref:Uncharacterized protein n=1 Tax=Nephila pilipes TaxID=299642 RepID=A0A8X6MUD6_NEPPI|nr:hypothetical protein NPIL_299481 [Nephila pilipes]
MTNTRLLGTSVDHTFQKRKISLKSSLLAFKDDLLVVPSIIFFRSIKSIKVGIRNKLSIFSSQVLEKIFHHAIPVCSPCLGRLGGVCCCTVALLWWLLWRIQWLRSSISRLQSLWSLQPCSWSLQPWILVEEMSKRIEAAKGSVLRRRPGTYVKFFKMQSLFSEPIQLLIYVKWIFIVNYQ